MRTLGGLSGMLVLMFPAFIVFLARTGSRSSVIGAKRLRAHGAEYVAGVKNGVSFAMEMMK